MRSYRHTEYAIRALDLARMDDDARMADLEEQRAELDARGQGGFIIALPPFMFDDERTPCCECGIGHVGACDTHAVQVALVLAGVQR